MDTSSSIFRHQCVFGASVCSGTKYAFGPVIATIVVLIVLMWPQKFADFSKLVKIRSRNTFAPSNMMVRHAESSSGHDAKLREFA